MSDTVDKRIVELEFDNESFKDRVSETIEGMQKLKESLKLEEGATSFKSISEASSKINFSDIIKGTDEVGSRFSGLKEIARNAFDGIQDIISVFSKGAGIAGLLTTLPIIGQSISGGMARAQKLAQAKFTMEGLGVEWVDISKNIKNSVEGTAYGLDDAAVAASSLVASGVQIGDDMETVLTSIAGLAAMTNSDYAGIANIMTTVAGQGKLMTMQLRQLETRGFNAAASIRDYMRQIEGFEDITEGEVRELVTQGEISFQLFADAMATYGNQAKEANKTLTGAMSNVNAALSRTTADFFEQVMGIDGVIPVINDFRILINSLNNQTNGLMHFSTDDVTGEVTQMGVVIRGVLDILQEVDRAFKDVFQLTSETSTSSSANYFERWGEVFKAMEPYYQGFFAFIKNAAYDMTMFGFNVSAVFRELLNLALKVFKPVADAFYNVFGTTLGDIFKVLSGGAESLWKSLAALEPSQFILDGIQTVFTGIFTAAKAVATLFSGALTVAFKVFNKVAGLVFNVLGFVLERIEDVASFLGGVTESVGGFFTGLLSSLGPVGEKVSSLFDKITKPFRDFFGLLFNGPQEGETAGTAFDRIFDSAKSSVSGVLDNLNLGEAFTNISSNLSGIGEFFSPIIVGLSQAIKTVFEDIGNVLSSIDFSAGLSRFVDAVTGALSKIGDFLGVKDVFKDIGDASAETGNRIEAFASKVAEVATRVRDVLIEKFGAAFEFIRTVVSDVWGFVGPVLSNVADFIGQIVDGIWNAFQNSGLDFSAVSEFFKDLLDNIKSLIGEGDLISFFSNLGESFKNLIDGIGPGFKNLLTEIGKVFEEQKDGPLGAFIKFFEGLIGLFTQFPEAADGIPASIEGIFNNLGNFIANPFGASFGEGEGSGGGFLGDFVSGIFSGLGDFGGKALDIGLAFEKLVDILKNPLTALYNFLTGIFSTTLGAFSDVLNGLLSGVDLTAVKNFVSEVTSIGASAVLLWGGFSFSSLISNLASITSDLDFLVKSFTKIGNNLAKGIEQVSFALKKAITAHAISEVLISLTAFALGLAGAIYIISTIPDPWAAAGILGGFLVVVGVMIALIGRIQTLRPDVVASVASTAIALGFALLSIAAAVWVLASIQDLDRAIAAGVEIGVLLVVLGIVASAIGAFSKEAAPGIGIILALVIAIRSLVSALKTLETVDGAKIQDGMTAFAAMLASIIVTTMIMSVFSGSLLSIAVAIIAFAAAFYIIQEALGHFQSIKMDDIFAKLGVVAAGFALLIAVMKVLQVLKIPEELVIIGAGLFLVASAFIVLAGAMKVLSSIGGSDMGAVVGGMIGLSVGLILLAAAIKIVGSPGTLKGAAALVVASIGLGMLVAVMWAMSNLPWENLTASVIAFILAVAGIAVLSVLLSMVEGPMTALNVTLLGLGGALMLIVGSFALFVATLWGAAYAAPGAINALFDAFDIFKARMQGQEAEFMEFCRTMGAALAQFLVGFLGEIGVAISTWLANWNPDIAGFFQNLLQALITGIGSLGQIVLGILSDLAVTIINWIGSLFTDATRLGVSSINAELQNAYDTQDWANAYNPAVESAIDGATQTVERKAPEYKNALNKMMGEGGEEAAKEGAERSTQAFEDNFEFDWMKVLDGSMSPEELTSQLLNKYGGSFSADSGFDAYANAFGSDMWNATSAGLELGASSNPVDIVDLLIKQGVDPETAAQYGDLVGQSTAGATGEAFYNTVDSDTSYEDGVNKMVERTAGGLSRFEGAGKNNAVGYVDSMKKTYDASTTGVTSAISNLVSKSTTNAKSGEKGATLATSYINSSKNTIGNATSGFANTVATFLKNANSKADPAKYGKEGGKKYGEGSASGFNSTSSKFIDTAKSIGSAAAESKEVLKHGNTLGSDYGKNVSSGLNTMKSNFVDIVGKFTAAGNTKDNRGQGWGVGEGYGGTVSSAVWSKREDVKRSVGDTLEHAKNNSDAEGKGKATGGSFSQGMVQGIYDNEWKVQGAASAVAGGAMGAALAAIKAQSPSREMIKWGKWFDLGMVIGLETYGNRVANAAYGVADQAVGNANESMSLLGGLFDAMDWDTDPVITPVLDLDQFRSGVGMMNDMMPDGSIIGAANASRLWGDANTNSFDNSAQNGGNTIYVTLDWDAGTTPNQMVKQLASELELLNLSEGR